MKHTTSIILLFLFSSVSFPQNQQSYFDYNVFFYDLNLLIDPPEKYLEGSSTIHFEASNDFDTLRINLYSNLEITSIKEKERKLSFSRDSHSVFVEYSGKKGAKGELTITYKGNPLTARNAPWEGGFVWSADSMGNPWVGVACQGAGASLWWPCKEDFSDEPDSMRLRFSIPQNLFCVSNGTLKNISWQEDRKVFEWFVHYPINTYNATVNIGKYASWKDSLMRRDGTSLSLEYYVLENNFDKAKKHFEQVKPILQVFEKLFGKYPFPKDGYALVETPYWGMEHQSAISYGNNYKNDLFDFDFIIVHETAHEWWGNSLTAIDIGELWLHESFASYAEVLLIEDHYGYEQALKYLAFQKSKIRNKQPLILPSGSFQPEDTDIYYKGSWMLHTLRNNLTNDSLWFRLLKKLSGQKSISIVHTKDVIRFFEKETGKDLKAFFDQYLYHSSIPILEYYIEEKKTSSRVYYRWNTPVSGFEMPVFLTTGTGEKLKLNGSKKWQSKKLKGVTKADIHFMPERQLIRIENVNKTTR